MVSFSIARARRDAGVATLWRSASGSSRTRTPARSAGSTWTSCPPMLARRTAALPEHPAAARGRRAGDRTAVARAELRRPLVYATMGTVFNTARVVRAAARRALRARPSARSSPSAATSIRRARRRACDVRVEQFVPQDARAALPARPSSRTAAPARCSAALTAGLPLVLLPQGADQFDNAARCERAGAALSVPPDDADSGRGRGRLRPCSSEPSYRGGGRADRRPRFAEMQTADEVAAAVEEHAARR